MMNLIVGVFLDWGSDSEFSLGVGLFVVEVHPGVLPEGGVFVEPHFFLVACLVTVKYYPEWVIMLPRVQGVEFPDN